MTKPLRVLLIEDSEDILFVMTTELECMGYQVETASNGENALKVARAKRPDLIISDVRMPGIDGLEFIRKIRQDRTLAAVPAIAVTGFSSEHDIKEMLDHGFTAYLIKPVEPEDLGALIKELTERKKLTKAS